jgi:RNA polymerase sigma factor (sigma-70 family)
VRPRHAPVSSRIERRLWRCIGRLPATYRAVWRLGELHELSTHKIAKRLNLPLPAVRSRLRRARLMLRTILREEFGDRVWLPGRRTPRT